MPTSIRVILLVTCVAVLGGCFAGAVAVGAAGGYAATKVARNKAICEYRTTVRGAYDATLAILPALGYPMPSAATLGPTEAQIEAGDATVKIAEFPGGGVRVAVSVGTFETSDHRRRAALIHERLAARLGPPMTPTSR